MFIIYEYQLINKIFFPQENIYFSREYNIFMKPTVEHLRKLTVTIFIILIILKVSFITSNYIILYISVCIFSIMSGCSNNI